MLEVQFPAETVSRLEWIVCSVDGRSQRERRESLLLPKRRERRLVAHSEIDAEVHVSGVEPCELERVVRTGRCPVSDKPRKRRARAVSPVNIDTGCSPPVAEESERELVGVRDEPRLPEVGAQVVRGREVPPPLAANVVGEIAENEFSIQRAR